MPVIRVRVYFVLRFLSPSLHCQSFPNRAAQMSQKRATSAYGISRTKPQEEKPTPAPNQPAGLLFAQKALKSTREKCRSIFSLSFGDLEGDFDKEQGAARTLRTTPNILSASNFLLPSSPQAVVHRSQRCLVTMSTCSNPI